MKKMKILIVEDEAIIALDMKLYLECHGYNVCAIATTADEATSLTEEHHPDVILMDILLKGEKTGIDAARTIQKDNKIPIIYMTGNPHLLDEEKRIADYPFWVISKPPSNRLISEILNQLT